MWYSESIVKPKIDFNKPILWYSESIVKPKIDFNKPIFATNTSLTAVLMPRLENGSGYKVVGYDWFDIRSGIFNSCCCFKTAQLAIDSYLAYGEYKVSNGEIAVKYI
jgi:hypothetical protein